MATPSAARLAAVFVRTGNLTFGGGDPTMAALQRELVDRRGWLTAEQYGLIFALARITPGTNVLAFCAGAGWRIAGAAGAVVAVLGASAPSAVVAVWLLSVYQTAAANVWAAAGMNGVAAAVAGLMVAGAWLLIRPHLRDGNGWRTLLTAGMAFGLSAGLGWPPVPILGAAAALGWIWKEEGR